jgi:Domain of unknown function (DUF6438)
MLWRVIISILICTVMSSAAYTQGDPTGIKAISPRVPIDLNGMRIKLVRTSCFGFCPDYSIEILGDGEVVYEGHRLVKVKGTHQGHVSIDAVRQLANLFVSAGYFSFGPVYGECGGDAPTTVTSIKWPGVNRTVTDCVAKPLVEEPIPPSLVELESAIDITVNSQQWVGTDKERMRN